MWCLSLSTKMGDMPIVRRWRIRIENYWRVFFFQKTSMGRGIGNYSLCLFGLSANQPTVLFSHTKSAPATSYQLPASQQYYSLITNQHQPSATAKRTQRLKLLLAIYRGLIYFYDFFLEKPPIHSFGEELFGKLLKLLYGEHTWENNPVVCLVSKFFL